MQKSAIIGLSLLSGAALGAGCIETIHAQGKPMAYVIALINVKDQNGFSKDFSPKIGKTIADAGGKFIVRGGKSEVIHGASPAPRLVITQFPSLEKAMAWANSEEAKAAWKVGDKYATFTDYAVEAYTP